MPNGLKNQLIEHVVGYRYRNFTEEYVPRDSFLFFHASSTQILFLCIPDTTASRERPNVRHGSVPAASWHGSEPKLPALLRVLSPIVQPYLTKSCGKRQTGALKSIPSHHTPPHRESTCTVPTLLVPAHRTFSIVLSFFLLAHRLAMNPAVATRWTYPR